MKISKLPQEVSVELWRFHFAIRINVSNQCNLPKLAGS